MISTHRRKQNSGGYHKTKMLYCIKLMKLYLAHFDLRGHLRPLEAIFFSAIATIVRAHHSVHLADENILLGMISVQSNWRSVEA